MHKNVTNIEIKFSEKFEKNLKRYRQFTLLLPLPALIILILMETPLYKIIIMSPLFIIIILIAYLAVSKGDGRLPIKVRINEKGIYSWQRNNKEKLVPWDHVYKIREMDSISPEDYVMICSSKGKNQPPGTFDYYELALDKNAAQIAIEKFNEYKDEKGIL